ncbi:hypothetical protein DRP07_07115 [Archaeoglobales archaeon]|nr:MAG: hypothetical protein DRP07_07115 [Archaeoglobales archaeon]
MPFNKDVFSSVKDWLIEEGILKSEVPDEMADWHYVVEFPAKSNQVSDIIKPKNRRMILLLSGIVLSETHYKAFSSLTPEEKQKLVHRWKMDLIFRKADFRFIPDSMNLQRIEFSIPIFEDGLSKSSVIEALRELFKCKLYIIWNVQHEFDKFSGVDSMYL